MLDHFGDDLLWYLDDFILRKQPRINVWHCSIYSIRQMLPVQQLVRARAALLVPQTPSLISPDTARACLPPHMPLAPQAVRTFFSCGAERDPPYSPLFARSSSAQRTCTTILSTGTSTILVTSFVMIFSTSTTVGTSFVTTCAVCEHSVKRPELPRQQ